MPTVIIDFETRSTIDLTKCGARVYAAHPTTDVTYVAYVIGAGEVKSWKPGEVVPAELVAAAADPDFCFAAFNASFERQNWRRILCRRYGWPALPPMDRWCCLQARALARAFPAALKGVAKALGLEHQKADDKVMKLMAKPRKPRKGEDPAGIYWHDDPEHLEQLYAYCKQDVEVERELAGKVAELSAEEQQVWQLDQVINERGFFVDPDLLAGALKIVKAAGDDINAELRRITNRAIKTVDETKKMLPWLAAHDWELGDIKKETVRRALTRKGLPPEVRRVLELRRDGAHKAAIKPLAIAKWRNEDGRVCDTFWYHRASTGRWGARGPQPQNLKKPDESTDLALAIELVTAGNIDRVRAVFPQLLLVVAEIARALPRAAPGHRFICGDFSGIESRVVAWLAGQQSKIAAWLRCDTGGDDPYTTFGRDVLGLGLELARKVGKVADLAFSYCGGLPAWKIWAKKYGLPAESDDAIRQKQRLWRGAHCDIENFWRWLDRGAIQATRTPGKLVRCNKIAFEHDGTHLYMLLPSGRKLTYPFAKLITNGRGNPVVSFKDVDKKKWVDCRHGQGAYPGTWIENATQAVARDLLAGAMQRVEATGYQVVMHIHDELVCEVPLDFGSAEEFEQLMTVLPPWAVGLPIAAKVRNGPRFIEIKEPKEQTAPPPSPEEEEEPKTPEEPDEESASDPPDDETEEPEAEANGRDHDANDKPHYTASNDRKHGASQVESVHIYKRANGCSHLRVTKMRELATGEKWYLQDLWDDYAWVRVRKGDPHPPPIPYRLPELLAASATEPIGIGEGEGVCDALAALGFVVTTNPYGAGKWPADFHVYFVGRREVWIFEDNDEDGRKHTAVILASLAGVVPTVKVIRFPELPPKKDVKNWLALGHSKEELLARIAEVKPEPPQLRYVVVRASEITAQPLIWMWRGHLLCGSLELLTGLPGLGKSQLQCQFVANITTGRVWPNGENGHAPANVVMATAEDCLDQILIPRLMAAGANLERVHILRAIRKDKRDRMFLLSEDLDALEQLIGDIGDVSMVTLDPITAYMGGKLDSHKVTDVRDQLGPLAALADRLKVVISAVTHPAKNAGPRAIDHYIGSQAFIAATRIGHLSVAETEEEGDGGRRPTGRVLFTNPKNNPHPRMPTIAYRLEETEAAPGIRAPRVVWEEVVDVSADEAIAALRAGKDRQTGVVVFLLDILAGGPVLKSVIEERGSVRGFSIDQLDRAKKKMGVVAFKENGQLSGRWFWALPQHAPPLDAEKETS
jgi:DNA polymerase